MGDRLAKTRRLVTKEYKERLSVLPKHTSVVISQRRPARLTNLSMVAVAPGFFGLSELSGFFLGGAKFQK